MHIVDITCRKDRNGKSADRIMAFGREMPKDIVSETFSISVLLNGNDHSLFTPVRLSLLQYVPRDIVRMIGDPFHVAEHVQKDNTALRRALPF